LVKVGIFTVELAFEGLRMTPRLPKIAAPITLKFKKKKKKSLFGILIK
jgi:hypothetical protein